MSGSGSAGSAEGPVEDQLPEASTAAPAPATTPGRGLGWRFARFSQWISDKANPLFIRYVRQELRNRTFFAIFTLLLIISCLASIIVAADAKYASGREGLHLFAVLGGTLSFALWVAQTVGAYRAVIRERDDDTWDLIDLTGMRPYVILRGMMFAGLVQGAFYTAAIAPFMVMAYLLRGIDLVSIVVILFFLQLIGTATTAFAVFWGCLGPNKASRALLGGLLFIAVLAGWFGTMGVWAELDDITDELSRSFMSGAQEAWTVLGLIVNMLAAFIALLLVFSNALLTFRANNRSTGPRLIWLAIWLNTVAWVMGTLLYYSNQNEEILVGLIICSLITVSMALVLGAFSISEDYVLSPRQARWLREGRSWRRLLGWALGPGAARGRLLLLAWLVVGLGIGLAGIYFISGLEDVSGWELEFSHIGMVIALELVCYGLFYLFVSDLLYRSVLAGVFNTPASRRAFILLVVAVVSILPLIIQLAVGENWLCTWISPIAGMVESGEFVDRMESYLNTLASHGPTSTEYVRAGTKLSSGYFGIGFVCALGLAGFVAMFIQAMRHLRVETRRVYAESGDRNPRGGE